MLLNINTIKFTNIVNKIKKMLKKNILIICSWLDISKGIGSFFVEQAELMNDSFNVNLVHFKSNRFGFNKRNMRSILIKINTQFTNNQTPIYEVNYPEFYFFQKTFFKKIIEKRAQKKLLHTIKSPIDLCHAQSFFDAGFWCYSINKNFKIPYIFTEHNQLNLKILSKKKISLLQQAIHNASEKLVVSDDLIRQFASNDIFFDFNKLGNTFDENCFSYSKRLKSDIFKIITVGAYTPIKNYETLFDALKIIEKKIFSEIHFTWIGCDCWGGDNEQIVNQLTKSLGLKNIKIKIIKSATKYEIANELKTSNVFISTSLCETFGVSVLEALACGIPVISSNSGGVTEMINQQNGIICPIKNSEEIAKNILKLYNKEIVFDNEKISENIKLKFGSTIFKEKLSLIYTKNSK
jgi:glycosyltransferase involved in cell wall biosynthesis